MQFRVIGLGRAGESFRRALTAVGWTCTHALGKGDDVAGAASAGADITLLAVPDNQIQSVAESIRPGPCVIVHLSGATPPEPLQTHNHAGSVHPLVSLPDASSGSDALRRSAFFAVSSDTSRAKTATHNIVAALDGTAFDVPEEARPTYHAAASVAANHLVALCAQVERLAASASVPPDGFWALMDGVLENVRTSGARQSLTGPVSRGDWETVRRHLDSIDAAERDQYLELARAAASLAGQQWPDQLT